MLTLFLVVVTAAVAAMAAVARLELPLPRDRALAVVSLGLGVATAAPLVAALALGGLTTWRVAIATAVIAVVALALAGRRRVYLLLRAPRPPVRFGSPFVIALVALAGVEVAWRTFSALVLPPYAYDALTYHLTIVASWIADASLEPTQLSLCCARYPASGELLFAWPALYTGIDTGVDLIQLGAALAGAAATAAIARTLGVSRGGAAAAGALFFLTPVVLAQTTTNYVDVIQGTALLLTLAFVVRYLEDPDQSAGLLVAGGVAAGIAVGTKPTGVLMLAVLVALIWVRLFAMRARVVRPLSALVVPAVALGSYWYVRNLIETGNPVHPVEVEVLGATLFAGPIDYDELLTVPVGAEGRPWPVQVVLSWARDLAPWISADAGYSYEQRLGGLGPVWVYLGAPLTLVVALRAIRRRRWSTELDVLVPLAVLFVLQPYQWWSRFTLFLAAVGAIAVVLVRELVGVWPRRALGVAAVALAAVGAWFATVYVNPGGRAEPLSALDVMRLADDDGDRRAIGRLFFPEYRWLDGAAADAVIGVELGADPRFVYPLFGPRLSRNVVRLAAGDRGSFLRSVRGLDYAFVARDGRLDAWLRGADVVYADDATRAYRLSDAEP